jgi:hypothetical protein
VVAAAALRFVGVVVLDCDCDRPVFTLAVLSVDAVFSDTARPALAL